MGKGPLDELTHKALFKSAECTDSKLMSGMLTMAEMLLKKKPELIDCRNVHERTPIIHACKHNNFECFKLYFKYNANLDLQDDNGYTALHYSAMNKNKDLTEFLINSGAKQDIADKKGKTAQEYAPQELLQLFDQIREA